jgi:hypothetical protein
MCVWKLRVDLLSLAAVLTLCGCLSNREVPVPTGPADLNDWALVASVAGSDHDTQKIVRDVLAKKGIVCFLQGSMGYGVFVPKDRLAEARNIIFQDGELKDRLVLTVLPKNSAGAVQPGTPNQGEPSAR